MSGDTKPNHWVRRRGYSKVHVKSWTIYLEKNGYVKCPFQNCNFMAFDVEEMYQHYSICNGDSSFAKFVCSICQGRTVSAEKLKNHKLKAHDVADVESTDCIEVEDDENSNDDTNDSTIKKAALSKVVILSWKCSLEENKYIKCPECDYLERDVSAMVNHYLDCKKDSVIACYVCPECKGKAVSYDILQCHMSYAHKVDISKINFNKISPRMVQIWYDEIAHNKFARCLHKARGVIDCLYFDTVISGIILHYQMCNGGENSVGTRHTCTICKHWTDSEEKIKVHVESCHVVAYVSRLAENTNRNSRNVDINSSKSKMSFRDFRIKVPGKSVKIESAGKIIFKEEDETNRRRSFEEVCRRRQSRDKEETSIMRDSIGYNLFDEVEVTEVGKSDLNDDGFVSAEEKPVQQFIDLPSDISDTPSTMYCPFLHTDLLSPVKAEKQARYSDTNSAVCKDSTETISGVRADARKCVDSTVSSEGRRRESNISPKQSISKPTRSSQNTTNTVDLVRQNQNVTTDDASVKTDVLTELAESKVNAKLRKDVFSNSIKNFGNVKTECQQDLYEDVENISVEIMGVKNNESHAKKSEETNTVCNYVVEVCNEDEENKDVLCFKITDLDESKSIIEPVVEVESAVHHDVTQSTRPDISFQSDDGSVKNVYVVSGDLAAMDTQNMTDESSNKTVIDSEHQSVIECDSVSSDTRELTNVVVDSSANTSDSQMDTESPRLVHFFKRGRLSIPPDDKKKVVCVGFRKDKFFPSRLAQGRCKPVFDEKQPCCSGVNINRKPGNSLMLIPEPDLCELVSTMGSTSTVVSNTSTVDVDINGSVSESVPIESASEIVGDNSTCTLENDNAESYKAEGKQLSEVNEAAPEGTVENKETSNDIVKRDSQTVCEDLDKDKNINEQNASELTHETKASQVSQLGDSLTGNSFASESKVESFVNQDINSDHKTKDKSEVNADSVEKTIATEKMNIFENVSKEDVGDCSEEVSGVKQNNKGEVGSGERVLKNKEVNITKHMKNVGVRVSLGVQIKDMSVAKLRKIKKPIKNLVRKFCKEELRKYRSSKKYFHSKKPVRNLVKRVKVESTQKNHLVEYGIAEEEASVSFPKDSQHVGKKHLQVDNNLQVENMSHQKPDCVLPKTEMITIEGHDSNNISVSGEESEEQNIDNGNQCIENAEEQHEQQAVIAASQDVATDSSDFVGSECERKPDTCVSAEELNKSSPLKMSVGNKNEMTVEKDVVISQNTMTTTDTSLNKDEINKELRTAESSESCDKQECNVTTTVNTGFVDKPGELKTVVCKDENNTAVDSQEVNISIPPKNTTKKEKVKDCLNTTESSFKKESEGQDKATKHEDDKTSHLIETVDCVDCEDSALSPKTSVKTKSLDNNEKEEMLTDSVDIKEPEMSLARKVKYVDELEANYSSTTVVINNEGDDEAEILIYLTEDGECETVTAVGRTDSTVNNIETKETSKSSKCRGSSDLMKAEKTDESMDNDNEQSMTANSVILSNTTPVKRRRGRPSKQEILQRKLSETVAPELPSQSNNAVATSSPNTPSRLRRRTSISRRYLEDENPSFTQSDRRKRSRSQPLWYMTPENSNDSTDSSQPVSKRGRLLKINKENYCDSSSEDDYSNETKTDFGNKNEEPERHKDTDMHVEEERNRNEQSSLNDTNVSSEIVPVKRKRGRPRKNFNNISDLTQTNLEKESAAAQGRSKTSVDSGDGDDDNADNISVSVDSEGDSPRNKLVIKLKTFSKLQPGGGSSPDSVRNNDPSLGEKVKCGRCGEEMTKGKYLRQHKMKHYNLCWLEGEDPIDFANKDQVVSILLRIQKKCRIKMSFKCETCGVSKKSAVGYQSHLVFCGKSKEERHALMEHCPICGRIMMPSSLKVHIGAVHNKSVSGKDDEKEEDLVNFVRGKRAAATKAESALQDSLAEMDDIEITHRKRPRSPVDEITRQSYKRPPINTNPYQLSRWKKTIAENGFGVCYFPMCSFQSGDMDALRDHSKNCPHAPPKVYSCRHCDFEVGEEQEIIMHVRQKHEEKVIGNCAASEESSSEDEGSLDLSAPRTTAYPSKYPKLKFIRDLGKLYGSRFFHHALKLTYDMREENFSKDILFNDLKPRLSEWSSMAEDELEQYLPKTRTSVRLVTQNVEWHQIQLFESDFIDGVLTMFVGGPVWATAWAPVSDQETQQYLAVACHPDMDLEHAMGPTYTYKSLIQIWKFDELNNMKTDITKPKLIYGIAHDRGAVWSLEWCPSGCYQDDRVGIFAAGCSDGFIYIYSVPRENADESYKICKPKPSAVLNLGSEMVAQCTRLTWHKVAPHSVLAAGFASGMVGLWDLNTKSPLLRSDDVYYPFHVFQPHQSSVSGLCFGPSEEPQYLATASVDCSNKFWDLRNTSAPVTVHRKGCVTDLVWMQNWLSAINAYDEVYGYAVTSVLLNAYRDFCYQPCTLSPQIGVTWSLSSNDWMNSIACGDETGRVIISLPMQIAHIDEKKVKKNSKLALLNTLHDFGSIQEVKLLQDTTEEKSDKVEELKGGNGDSQSESAAFLKYNEAVARFGLSLKVDKLGTGIDQSQKKIVAPLSNPNMYPLTSVTKVSWNTNFRSFVFLAAGLQCGIVVIPRTTYISNTDLHTFYRKHKVK